MPKYVVALDQGTTSSRAMLVDANGCVVDAVRNPFPQVYPQPGWVEHDPRDILSSQLGALTELLVAHNLGAKDIDSIGITVTAADLPALWEAVEMIKGIPRPLAKPTRTEPVMVPTHPPSSQRDA